MQNDSITYIDAKNRLFGINFRELWRYRDLIFLLVKRDLVTAYKQTILGPIWIVIQPLMSTTVFTVIFGIIAHVSTDGMPQFLFYMSGNVLWGFFSSCLGRSSGTFTGNARIFGKVYFPRLVMPIAGAVYNFVNFILQTSVFVILVVVYVVLGANVHPNLTLLLTPLLVLQTALLSTGIGLIMSSLTAKYRDLNVLIGCQARIGCRAAAVEIVQPLSDQFDHPAVFRLGIIAPAPFIGVFDRVFISRHQNQIHIRFLIQLFRRPRFSFIKN